jgi:glycosyltransferase involved in cell wall biosynthesis
MAIDIRRVPIVLFTSSDGMGGMEAHVIALADRLVRQGMTVGALCLPWPSLAPLREALRASGAQVHAIPGRKDSLLGPGRRTLALVRTLRSYPGCILHLHAGAYNHHQGMVLAAAQVSGVRAIVRSEHMTPVPPIPRHNRWIVRVRDRLIDRVVYVSSQTRREHLELVGRDERRSTVVHNGIDPDRFAPRPADQTVAAEFGFDPACPIVGTVSRLGEERKGMRYFVEMAAAVSRRYPDCRFLVVGDGPLRPALEQQAVALGLERRIAFAGQRNDVPRLLSAMRIFVMPSLYEACQYNLLEAMAAGLPVVSTPVGVAPEAIVPGQTGLLAPVRDGEALAAGVVELLEEPHVAQEMGRRAREMVVDRFSLDAMVARTTRVYEEVA